MVTTDDASIDVSQTDHSRAGADDKTREATVKRPGLLDANRRQKMVLGVIVLNQLVAQMSQSIPAPFFPAEATRRGLTDTETGLVFGVFCLTLCIASPVFGKIMPSVGVRWLALVGQFVVGTFTIVFGLLHYIPVSDDSQPIVFLSCCLLTRVVLAVACAAINTAYFSIAAETFSENQAVVFGLIETTCGVSFMIGPGVGGLIYEVGGFVMPFVSVGVLLLVIMPTSIYVLPRQLSQESPSEADDLTVSSLLRMPTILVTLLATCVASMQWVLLDPTLEPHLRQFKLNSGDVGAIFLLLSATYAIASPICGSIADRMENSCPLLVIGFLTTGVGMLLLGPSPAIYVDQHCLWLNLVAISVLGMALSFCIVPTYDRILTTAKRLSLSSKKGNPFTNYPLIAGMWHSVYAFGGFIGPVIAGWSSHKFGFGWMTTGAATICFLVCQRSLRQKASDIAVEAKKEVGSTLWSFESSHGTGCDTNKCNTFVADMIERAGGSVPQRHVWKKSPIGAREWENPKSTYLTSDPHWVLVIGTPKRGDIAALGGHVGIVTGPGTTISATATKIVENDWGFHIAAEAKKEVGSTLWSFESSHGTGCDTNKCNTFVADMIERAGGSVPQRHVWKKSPIGAREWENPKSTYLTGDPHWVLVTGTPKPGDIAAYGGHVGIVTGPDTTISATAANIVENDWGFRKGQKPTFWRYVP
ncbi:MFS-type transporter SLC18B1 [Lamellibrachia satsuma]|nr:MFS-type transporter SLC18B1 [Lamellibrachia satsuma]